LYSAVATLKGESLECIIEVHCFMSWIR